MEARKTEIAMRDSMKSDLARKSGRRMGTLIDRRNWRMLTENVVKKLEEEKR